MSHAKFIQEMKLTKAELETFERLLAQIEAASKEGIKFPGGGGTVAFTPGAALGIAVAKFAYDLYKDYRNSWLLGQDKVFEKDLKNIIKEFHKFEQGAKGSSMKVSDYKTLRKSIAMAKKNA